MKPLSHDELSHELRTPLTSVLGYTTTLLDRWESIDDVDRLAFLRIVYAEALRMAVSVEQLDRRLYDEFARAGAHSDEIKPRVRLADAS